MKHFKSTRSHGACLAWHFQAPSCRYPVLNRWHCSWCAPHKLTADLADHLKRVHTACMRAALPSKLLTGKDLGVQSSRPGAVHHDHAEIFADACSSLALMDTAADVAKEIADAGITIVFAPLVNQYTQVCSSVGAIRIAQLQPKLQLVSSRHFCMTTYRFQRGLYC